MAKDLEKINVARVAQGLAPLDKLPDTANVDQPPAGETNKPPVDPPPPTQPPAGDPPAQPPKKGDVPPKVEELDDDALLKALQKRGVAATSLDDLKPKEDPAKVAEQREVKKLTYGINKGLYTLKEHQDYLRDKDNPKDLVFGEYYDEAKKADDTLSDEDIQAEFEQKYGMNTDPNSWKYKRGLQEIGLLADKLLQDKYGKIFTAEREYTTYETTENLKQTRSQNILSKAPAYKRDLDTVFDSLKKIPVEFAPGESYEIDVPPEAWEQAKALFSDPDTAAAQIGGGYTPETLKDVAYTALLRENFQVFMVEAAKQYHLKRQAGVRGIPPVGPQSRQPRRELTENQKKVLADNGINEDDLPPVSQN